MGTEPEVNTNFQNTTLKKSKGCFKIAEIGNTSIFVHWSLPLGGVFVGLYGHLDPRQWLYYSIALTCLIVIHEVGHVIAAISVGLKIFAVEISGLGGLCRIERPRRVWHGFLVYSAGLIAQFVLFLFTQAYLDLRGVPSSEFEKATVNTFTYVNIIVFIINVIPGRGFRRLGTDGYVLWRLVLHVLRGHPHPLPPLVAAATDQSPIFAPETRLLSKTGFRPHGFMYGIEILNDRTTPMEFVVSVLIRHLKISRDEAIVKMLDIHNNGGMLISFPSAQEGRCVAEAIATEACAAGYSFVCRYADEQMEDVDTSKVSE